MFFKVNYLIIISSMDRVWYHRGVPYKICLISLIIGIWPFLLGFGAPDWLWFSFMDENGTSVDGSFGLWQLCIKNNQCYNNAVTGNEVVNGKSFLLNVIQTFSNLSCSIIQLFFYCITHVYIQ